MQLRNICIYWFVKGKISPSQTDYIKLDNYR